MYTNYFRLRTRPFEMSPDSNMLFLSNQHREALAGISYAITARKGFAVLIGEAGTGKTSLLTRALQYLPQGRINACAILNPILTPSEFLESVLLEFGVENVPSSKAQRLALLRQLLVSAHRSNKISALVIDEAHLLDPGVLEEIRLLGNYEQINERLLQIILAGQPALTGLLNRPSLYQLKQRIAVRATLAPLVFPDIEKYMAFRWQKAGGAQPLPFSAEAIRLVAQYSSGIPRLINSICDHALVSVLSLEQVQAASSHVLQACRELDLIPEPRQAQIASPVVSAVHSSAVAAPVSQPIAKRNEVDHAMKTLDRYTPKAKSRSAFGRLATRLGIAN